MKHHHGLVLFAGIALLLSGCSSLSPVNTLPQNVQQAMAPGDRKQVNLLLDTVVDDQPQVWHSTDGDILYQLTTTDTYVNAQGLPCRHYSLLVQPKYHRPQTTNGLVCRSNDKWQLVNE